MNDTIVSLTVVPLIRVSLRFFVKCEVPAHDESVDEYDLVL